MSRYLVIILALFALGLVQCGESAVDPGPPQVEGNWIVVKYVPCTSAWCETYYFSLDTADTSASPVTMCWSFTTDSAVCHERYGEPCREEGHYGLVKTPGTLQIGEFVHTYRFASESHIVIAESDSGSPVCDFGEVTLQRYDGTLPLAAWPDSICPW